MVRSSSLGLTVIIVSAARCLGNSADGVWVYVIQICCPRVSFLTDAAHCGAGVRAGTWSPSVGAAEVTRAVGRAPAWCGRPGCASARPGGHGRWGKDEDREQALRRSRGGGGRGRGGAGGAARGAGGAGGGGGGRAPRRARP